MSISGSTESGVKSKIAVMILDYKNMKQQQFFLNYYNIVY